MLLYYIISYHIILYWRPRRSSREARPSHCGLLVCFVCFLFFRRERHPVRGGVNLTENDYK